jgi:hypothetical protein
MALYQTLVMFLMTGNGRITMVSRSLEDEVRVRRRSLFVLVSAELVGEQVDD